MQRFRAKRGDSRGWHGWRSDEWTSRQTTAAPSATIPASPRNSVERRDPRRPCFVLPTEPRSFMHTADMRAVHTGQLPCLRRATGFRLSAWHAAAMWARAFGSYDPARRAARLAWSAADWRGRRPREMKPGGGAGAVASGNRIDQLTRGCLQTAMPPSPSRLHSFIQLARISALYCVRLTISVHCSDM